MKKKSSFGLVLLLISFMTTSPVLAQKDERQYFGNYKCAQPIPCLNTDGASMDVYTEFATACMADLYGIRKQESLFQASAGIDMKGCLTSMQSNAASKELKFECCVVHQNDNDSDSQCVIKCARFAGN